MLVFLRGKIDKEGQGITVNVTMPCTPDINVLLLFFCSKDESKNSYTVIVRGMVEELILPLSLATRIEGTYYLEAYGLSSVSGDFFNFEAFGQKEFSVSAGCDVVSLGMELVKRNIPPVPLTYASQAQCNLLDHSLESKFIIRSVEQFPSEKIWILYIKQNGGKFFIVSSKQLTHTLPADLDCASMMDVKLIRGSVLHENETGTFCIIGNETNTEMMSLGPCEPIYTYDIQLQKKNNAGYSKVEYIQLLDKTVDFIQGLNAKLYPIDYFYRNKSKMYFQSIKENHNSIMKPYKKDFNGDPSSVINGRIDGLFFNTALNLSTMEPLPSSLFGPVRLHVEATELFTPNLNLYFADFYCHYKVHYVTVILTPHMSETDTFCKERLISLNIFKNPFIFLHEKSGDIFEVQAFQSSSLKIELFYTEPIDISNIIKKKKGHFSTVPILGRGKSSKMGIPKNKNCKICNL